MELQLESPVFSADGTDMGRVHRVIFDPQKAEVKSVVVKKGGEVHNMVIDPTSHKPSSVVVRSGFIFTDDVEIPGGWVESYDDRVVTLNVDKPTVEHLADSQKNDSDRVALSAAGAKDARQA